MTHVAPVNKKELLTHCFAGKFRLPHKTGYGCQTGFFANWYQTVIEGFSKNINNPTSEIAFGQLVKLRIVMKNRKPYFRIWQRYTVYFIDDVFQLSGVCLEKFSTCRNIKKQIFHRD